MIPRKPHTFPWFFDVQAAAEKHGWLCGVQRPSPDGGAVLHFYPIPPVPPKYIGDSEPPKAPWPKKKQSHLPPPIQAHGMRAASACTILLMGTVGMIPISETCSMLQAVGTTPEELEMGRDLCDAILRKAFGRVPK